jgi:hypothetical protein
MFREYIGAGIAMDAVHGEKEIIEEQRGGLGFGAGNWEGDMVKGKAGVVLSLRMQGGNIEFDAMEPTADLF